MHWFLKFIFGMKLYMFRTVSLSTNRSFSLYAQQWYMSYRFADSLRAAVSKPVWHIRKHIPLLCVQWKTPDVGQRNCPKHIETHSKNKFEKLVHQIGFIIRNLSQCTVTWTSNYFMLHAFAAQCRAHYPMFDVRVHHALSSSCHSIKIT